MDIAQLFGNDISLDDTGNLLFVSGTGQGQQALIRRLLTNPGSYIWHPEYGAGIGRFVGENLSTQNFDTIKSTIISQILEEDTVAKTPLPQITFTPIQGGVLQCDIIYYDSKDNSQQSISLPLALRSSNAVTN